MLVRMANTERTGSPAAAQLAPLRIPLLDSWIKIVELVGLPAFYGDLPGLGPFIYEESFLRHVLLELQADLDFAEVALSSFVSCFLANFSGI